MNKTAALLNLVICIAIGGMASYFTSAKWIATSLWVFAALFINGSLAFYEDAQPGGFDNPSGNKAPEGFRGLGAMKFWAISLLITASAIGVGVYVQLI